MAAINNDWLDALKGEFKKPYNKKLFEKFVELFQKSGYENVEHKRKKLIKNAIIQHILEKENRDGRPDVGILEIAAC